MKPDDREPLESAAAERGDPQTYAVIGAAMSVHGELGHGFLEPVYQEAMQIELHRHGVPFAREVPLAIQYKGELLHCTYKADFICYGEIIVELKALGQLGPVEQSQVLNYLKATGLNRALLLNFGTPRLQHKRFVR